MLKRIITGALVSLTVFLTIYFSYIPSVILCFTAVLCAFSVYEIFNAANMIKKEGLFIISLLISTVITFSSTPYYIEIIGIVFVFSLIAAIIMMFKKDKINLSNPFAAVLIAFNIVLLFSSFSKLRELNNGAWYLAVAVALSFLTDIFAYLIGRFFGKHKLLPSISPNKTVEGSFAGVSLTVALALTMGLIFNSFLNIKTNCLLLAIYAFFTSLLGEFGDLAMSTVKRICKIKDFGNILPGHGGILDRFDSVLFTVPFTYLFCSITGGFIC